MVTKTQIDRLSSRIDALADRVNQGPARTMDDPRVELMRRLRVIAERMGAAAEAEGNPFPPHLSGEERNDIVRQFREFSSARGTQPWSASRNWIA
jgi:hypothetical protein